MESIESYGVLYLATYAFEAPDGIYGYTKICNGRPVSVWQADGAFLKVASGPAESLADAIERARQKARDFIDAALARRQAGQAA